MWVAGGLHPSFRCAPHVILSAVEESKDSIAQPNPPLPTVHPEPVEWPKQIPPP